MADSDQQIQNNAPQEDIGQLIKVRRQKLADLQAAGKDPFQITKYDQTDHTADAKAAYEELEKKALLEQLKVKENITLDGQKINIYANKL